MFLCIQLFIFCQLNQPFMLSLPIEIHTKSIRHIRIQWNITKTIVTFVIYNFRGLLGDNYNYREIARINFVIGGISRHQNLAITDFNFTFKVIFSGIKECLMDPIRATPGCSQVCLKILCYLYIILGVDKQKEGSGSSFNHKKFMFHQQTCAMASVFLVKSSGKVYNNEAIQISLFQVYIF